MPNLDGVGVLKALPAEMRRRVVVVSMASGESDLGLAALATGAFDLVQKPTGLAIDSLRDIADELVSKVVLAGRLRPRAKAPSRPPVPALVTKRSDCVVLIGTSTGGPQALTRLLAEFPADFPAPIVIVLHIPIGYTAAFAARLDADCAIDVVEASEGLELRPGLAIVAEAGKHLYLTTHAGRARVHLDLQPVDSMHRPSVDVVFQSAARNLGPRALGVVLTGMGEDGLLGARAIVEAGGRVLTETEASCVVYGMPRVVKEAGLAEAEAPLEAMAAAIAARV